MRADLLPDGVRESAFDFGWRQRKAIDHRCDHRFGSHAKRVRRKVLNRVRRFRNHDVRTSLRRSDAASELAEGIRAHHDRRNTALFQRGRDVATPRRASSSVTACGDHDIDAPRELVKLAADSVEQLSRLIKRFLHRLFHHDGLQTKALLQ